MVLVTILMREEPTTDYGFDICSDGDIVLLYVWYEQPILGTTTKPSSQLQAGLQYNLFERDEGEELEVTHRFNSNITKSSKNALGCH
jgi:hypothetical protein